MKKLLFISLILIFSLSCKKQRLRKERDILVGEWQLEYRVEKWVNLKYDTYSQDDTLVPAASSPIILTIKKDGKAFLDSNGNREIYKLNFRTGERIGYEYSYFNENMIEGKIQNYSGLHEIGKYHDFVGRAFQKSNDYNYPIYGYVNQDKLILTSTGNYIMSNGGLGSKNDNYFIRIN